LKIIRDKKELTLQIKIGEAPDSLSAVKGKSADGQVEPRGESDPGQKWMGLTVRELTADLREQAGVSASQPGVIVSAVEENSKLEDAGILPGDVIVAVNQQPVPDLKAFKEVVKKVKLSGGVVFDLLRRGEALYLSYLGPIDLLVETETEQHVLEFKRKSITLYNYYQLKRYIDTWKSNKTVIPTLVGPSISKKALEYLELNNGRYIQFSH
jgi:membrane-associated protease RseP (regulator of RpoE activity)